MMIASFAFDCSLPTRPKQTSSRPKAAHFAAAVERSLYFVLALAVASEVCLGFSPGIETRQGMGL
jgi:hypothetical protein